MPRGSLVVVLTGAISAASLGSPWGQRPDALHAYSVHDDYRPDPPRVTVAESGIPSDAVALYDGTQSSIDRNWRSVSGGAVKWVRDGEGCFVAAAGSGYASTKDSFEDVQLHVEFATALDAENACSGAGNSGIYLPGGYEVQILDSKLPPRRVRGVALAGYADGSCGALYGQKPPDVNACRGQGEWQSFDIVFHPAELMGGQIVHAAELTVFHNGVLIHDSWRCEAPTDWLVRDTKLVSTSGPIQLQDHGKPVRFRNVWVRRLAKRSAYVYDGEFADRNAIAAKRRQLAERADDDWKRWSAEMPVRERLCRAWTSVGYCASPERLKRAELAEEEFLRSWKGKLHDDIELKVLYESLLRNGHISLDNAVWQEIHGTHHEN